MKPLCARPIGRPVLFALYGLLLLVGLCAIYIFFGPFYVNNTASMPRGIYFPTHELVTYGSLVVFPSYAINPYGEHLPQYLLKYVLPYRGEQVTLNDTGLYLGSTLIARRTTKEGTSFHGPLAADQVLLLGQTEDSFDSRYFGPVDIHFLTAVRPLLTW